ncbi:MAG: hypothetical protein HN380_11250 [Victivallales bacterium]|nr:hypothetical protein [Victivallales bacterium]
MGCRSWLAWGAYDGLVEFLVELCHLGITLNVDSDELAQQLAAPSREFLVSGGLRPLRGEEKRHGSRPPMEGGLRVAFAQSENYVQRPRLEPKRLLGGFFARLHAHCLSQPFRRLRPGTSGTVTRT